MLSLTITARQCNKSVSCLLGIVDEEIAFALDRECSETLYLWEQENEAMRIDALMGGTLASQLTGQPKMNGPTAGEITPSNFRDQSM